MCRRKRHACGGLFGAGEPVLTVKKLARGPPGEITSGGRVIMVAQLELDSHSRIIFGESWMPCVADFARTMRRVELPRLCAAVVLSFVTTLACGADHPLDPLDQAELQTAVDVLK